jgi:hypothetical protein
VVLVAIQMRHGAFVATAEPFAIVIPLITPNRGVPIGVMIVGVGAAVVIEVMVRSFDSVVKALSLHLAELVGWRVPSAVLRRACGWHAFG